MEKKTVLMLVLFVLLLAGVIGAKVALRPAGVREGDRPRPVVKLKASDIDGLTVTHAKAETVLKRSGESWSLTAPVSYPADASAVKTALEKLEGLSFEGIATDRPEKHPEYEVTEDQATHVVARKGSQVLVDLYVGKVSGGVTMTRLAGKNDVWRAVGALKYVFGKEPKNWRDHEVLTVKREEVEKVALETAAGTMVCTREAGESGKPDTWTLTQAPAGVKIDKLDDSVPAGIVSTMTSLRAYDFGDGVKPEDSGLAKPAATATVFLKGGAQKKLLVGSAKGDQYYVKVPDRDQVFLISKYSVERLTKKPADFRDKTVLDLKPADVVGLTIDLTGGQKIDLQRQGEDWKAAAPADLQPDPAKVKTLISGLTALKATGFADPGDARQAFAKPAGTLTIKLKDKGPVTLTFGALKDQDYPVQRVGAPEVYLFKKYAAERFLKKPDDLKKTAGGAGTTPPHRPGTPPPPVRVKSVAPPVPAPGKAPVPFKAPAKAP
jgi:hypothetical protein